MPKETGESSGGKKTTHEKHRRTTGFEKWGGYMAAKKHKLENQCEIQKEHLKQDAHQIFKNIAIYVNGYTKPSAYELKDLILSHGGKYHVSYYPSETTHVVASNLPKSKMKNLKTQIVVKADWITDSVAAGKLLSHQNYLLYTPEVVDKQQRLQTGKFFTKECGSSVNSENILKEDGLLDCFGSNSKAEPKKTAQTSVNNKNLPLINNINDAKFPEKQSTISKDSSHPNTVTRDASISPQTHNAAIKAGHSDFLTEFYNHSRLHCISTAGQDLKQYVQHLVESNKEKFFAGRYKLKCVAHEKVLQPNNQCTSMKYDTKNKTEHVIMHLDMDCFFVSVGLKKHPELRGHPVAVTHSKGKKGGPQEGSDINYEFSHYANESKEKVGGIISSNVNNNSKEKEYGSMSEIASCSYEARKAGVKNGMFLGKALKLCPNLKTMSYDFDGYMKVSKQLYDIVANYTLDIQAVSIDELYVDCTELLQDVQLSPYQFASILRAEIEEKTGCTASAGIGCNMLIARLANKVAKPNGQHYICESEIEEFMKKQKVAELPGVGYKTTQKLQSLNVTMCEDLQKWSLAKLQNHFGPKNGQSLYNQCRGRDDRIVQCHKERKSVSAEVNYGIRFETEEDVNDFIDELALEVQKRVKNLGCKGRSLTLKLMVRKSDAPVETAKFMGHGVCDNISKSVALKCATDSFQVIAEECCNLASLLKIKPQDYRGVGIQLNKLEPAQRGKETIKSYLGPPNNGRPVETHQKDGMFSRNTIPKIPEKGTIKHFFPNKDSSPAKKVNIIEDFQQPSTSFAKPSNVFNNGQKNKIIDDILLNKPSTSSAADYLPIKNDSKDLRRKLLNSGNRTSTNTQNAISKQTSVDFLDIDELRKRPEIDLSALEALEAEILDASQNEKSFFANNSILNPSSATINNNPLTAEELTKIYHELDPQNLSAMTEVQRDKLLDIFSKLIENYKQASASTTSGNNFDLGQRNQIILDALPEVDRNKVLTIFSKLNINFLQKSPSDTGSNPEQLYAKVLNSVPEDFKIELQNSKFLEEMKGAKTANEPYKAANISLVLLALQERGSVFIEPYKPFLEMKSGTEGSLAGAEDIDDIRDLIKEWVQGTEEPLEEDIDELKEFLLSIIETNLFKVDLIMKYLYRMAKKANENWQNVYLALLLCIQEKVKSLHDQRILQLESEF
ncbi:hypothetical protein CDAR_419441 [Caerostris darwini]|uniref:DNA repair protein REV1 n=1 Tax=Caerostris darwini TaxID=1538125 RepID=A0AAV4PUG2_9ARAC|nr:hypothetical protein CDAR_419441 [Caerostris darwini]